MEQHFHQKESNVSWQKCHTHQQSIAETSSPKNNQWWALYLTRIRKKQTGNYQSPKEIWSTATWSWIWEGNLKCLQSIREKFPVPRSVGTSAAVGSLAWGNSNPPSNTRFCKRSCCKSFTRWSCSSVGFLETMQLECSETVTCKQTWPG